MGSRHGNLRTASQSRPALHSAALALDCPSPPAHTPMQAAKCQQQLADLERKKADAQKSAAAAAADFQQVGLEI